MFARVVKFSASSEAAAEFVRIVHEKALPKIKAQPGCIDAIVETRFNGDYTVVGMSLWKSKQYAVRFDAEVFPEIEEMFRPYLKAKPVVRTTEIAAGTRSLIRRRAVASSEPINFRHVG